MERKTLNEIDSRAQRDTDWTEREHLALQDYLAITPEDEQSFLDWNEYAHIVRGLPIFEFCIEEEEFNLIRSMQHKAKRKARPSKKIEALTDEEIQLQEEKRIEREREAIRQKPEYKEAEEKGWVIDFRWQDGKGVPFIDDWLVKKGLVHLGPGGGGWPNLVFMRKNGRRIKASSLASSYSQRKIE